MPPGARGGVRAGARVGVGPRPAEPRGRGTGACGRCIWGKGGAGYGRDRPGPARQLACSLARSLSGWPVVPFVSRSGLLREEYLVEAAGQEGHQAGVLGPPPHQPPWAGKSVHRGRAGSWLCSEAGRLAGDGPLPTGATPPDRIGPALPQALLEARTTRRWLLPTGPSGLRPGSSQWPVTASPGAWPAGRGRASTSA